MKTKKIIIFSNVLMSIGILLLMNVIGFCYFNSIHDDDENVSDAHPRKISQQIFWDNAYKKNTESLDEYVNRLTKLISDRMLVINPRYSKPTIFENYILWAYSEYLDRYEWKNTKKAVRLGGGLCSQHAIILNNILREQSIESRIIGLSGHVLNEVFIDGKWKVYDPDFNISFNLSLKELEVESEKVYQAYKAIGHTEDKARHWQRGADLLMTYKSECYGCT